MKKVKKVKKVLMLIGTLIMLFVFLANFQLLSNNNKKNSDLTITGVQNAQAGLLEWWESNVYDCVDATCFYVIPYQICTTGTTIPHCWCCVSCSN